MKLNNKGQGAMEYLMTYGWAILVVMIVGVVLWQLGVFGGAGGGVNRATGFTNLKPFDRSIFYSAGATGVINATFTNAAGTPLTITDVDSTGDCTYLAGAADTTDTTLMRTSLTPGGNDISLSVAGGDTVYFTCPAGSTTDKAAGDTFTINVVITYTESVAGTTLSHTDSGRMTGTVE
ncbi:MAG: hypothetical protein JW778_07575 [Candidatus Altiarchaeota archaeon]|nr:hypothetical protein [Candidatus Altiarchaeota archaeon]